MNLRGSRGVGQCDGEGPLADAKEDVSVVAGAGRCRGEEGIKPGQGPAVEGRHLVAFLLASLH